MADNPVGVAEAVKRAREIAAKMLPAAGISINGDDANSRKRPLDDGDNGPQMKKPTIEGGASAQAIAQAAIAKVGAQLGLNHMLSVEIKVPNRLVGLVIGRQGEMISKLQAESGARIQVAPDGSEVNGERCVSICGTQETVERAKILVSRVVEDAGGATNMPALVEPGQEVYELMVPASKVGLVIGKGGEMIKTLQESAGCKMQMIQDGAYANAPEKPLRMTGSAGSCAKARELVLQLIEQKDLEARGHGMAQTTEIEVPKALVGFVIGRNGEHINNIQNTCGVRLQFQNDIPGTDYRIATISGNPESCHRAQKMVEDIVAEVSNKSGIGGGGSPVGLNVRRTGGAGFKPHIELPNPTGPGVVTVQFPVPANKCGLIIGKGGDTIRQLQVQSGAHIELHRGNHPNPAEKLFNIRGTQQEIAQAQHLLQQKIEGIPNPTTFSGQQVQGFQGAGGQGYNPQAGGAQYPQYSYQQAYVAAGTQPQSQQQQQQQQQPQASDPSHQAAWASYYQQLYAAQAAQAAQAQAAQTGATQQGGPPQQPQPQTQTGQGDVQSQWAEYYRSMGYAYYGQQSSAPTQGGQPPTSATPTTSSGERK